MASDDIKELQRENDRLQKQYESMFKRLVTAGELAQKQDLEIRRLTTQVQRLRSGLPTRSWPPSAQNMRTSSTSTYPPTGSTNTNTSRATVTCAASGSKKSSD